MSIKFSFFFLLFVFFLKSSSSSTFPLFFNLVCFSMVQVITGRHHLFSTRKIYCVCLCVCPPYLWTVRDDTWNSINYTYFSINFLTWPTANTFADVLFAERLQKGRFLPQWTVAKVQIFRTSTIFVCLRLITLPFIFMMIITTALLQKHVPAELDWGAKRLENLHRNVPSSGVITTMTYGALWLSCSGHSGRTRDPFVAALLQTSKSV